MRKEMIYAIVYQEEYAIFNIMLGTNGEMSLDYMYNGNMR